MSPATLNLFEPPMAPIAASMPVPTLAPVQNSDVMDRLGGHAWDFSDSKSSRQSLHAIHPYPAKFIPEIPRALIAAFPPADGSLILDPFCGSGTTLVEAQRAGFGAIGVDLNPNRLPHKPRENRSKASLS